MTIEEFLQKTKERKAELAKLGYAAEFDGLVSNQFQDELLAEFRESVNQKLDWSDSPTNLQIEEMLSLYLGGDAA